MTRVSRKPLAAGPPDAVLIGLVAQLRALGYDRVLPLPGNTAAIVWGVHAGAETPRIFLQALADGEGGRADADCVLDRLGAAPPPDAPDDASPQFAVLGDGTRHVVFDVGFPPHALDQLPPPAELCGRRTEV